MELDLEKIEFQNNGILPNFLQNMGKMLEFPTSSIQTNKGGKELLFFFFFLFLANE